MSQGPVPPRYPPQNPYQPQQPAPQMPQQPMSPPPIQQPQMPAYPQAEQDGFLVNVPGQPPAVQSIPYYTPGAQQGGGVWNYGGILVMHKQANLPPQCIKCCAPAEGEPLKRKLTWHTPWLYLFLLFMLPGWILLAIIALAIQETATIYIGLCSRHRRRRNINLLIAWGILAAAIVSFVAAGNIHDRETSSMLVGVGILLVFISPVYGLLACRMVVPAKIDRQYIWLKGVSREFAAQFPAMLPQH